MPSAPQTRVLDPRDAKGSEYTAAWDAITKLTREGSSWSGYERKNVFLNCGPDHAFASVPGVTGLDYNDDGRAAALVDWDGDGAQDLWLRNRTGPRLRLMRNRGAGQGFVALKLEGTGKTNRDAIGARVTVKPKDAPLVVNTLRAGEGFLSQGSKTLTFGLGMAGAVESVQVRWPGGNTETFTGVESGGRFLLRQGGGKAERLTPPAAVKLPAKTLPPLAITGQIAVSLPVRVPLPQCPYTLEDGTRKLVAAPAKPLLLLFFSHTCPNCEEEMAALASAKGRLDAAGLDVLALSIDAATSGDPAAAAFQTLKSRSWPWPAGTAEAAAIHHTQEFTRTLLEYPPPPSVPAAYLIAPGDKVSVLYRGAIGADRLLFDLPAATCPPDDLRDRSIPVAGRWFTSSHTDDAMLEWIFKHFGPAFLDQRVAYLEQAAAKVEGEAKEGFHNQIAASRHKRARDLATEKKLDEAEAQFAAAASIGVKNPALYNDYGALLAFRGKHPEAAAQYRRALEVDPGFSLARENLAKLPSRP